VVSASLVRDVVRLLALTQSGVATTPIVLAMTALTTDGLLSLIGVGREIWAGEDAQDYVNRLRAAWR
jgi:hypothetical protein